MITKITREQQEQIPIYIKKWIDLASKPIDKEKSFSLVKEVFKDKNPLVIFGESCQNTIDLIKLVLKICKAKIGSQLGSQLHSQLYFQLHSQLYSQLGSQLGSQLHSQLDSQLDSQLHSQLGSQLHSQLGSQKVNWDYYISYYWQSWAGYYDFGQMIGVEFDAEKLEKYFNFILNMPICIFIGNIVFICEKPQVLWDNDGRLHSEINKAIGWKDDTGFYYLHRVRFEKDLWLKVISGKMSFSEVLKIENTEQRAQAMRYNPAALMQEKPKLVHKSKTKSNELWVIENSEVNNIYDEPKVWLLGFIDPSKQAPNNKLYEEVDPKLCELTQDADVIQAFHLYQNNDPTISKERIEMFSKLYGELIYES